MGAQQAGYIVKGPAQISDETAEKAVKHVLNVLTIAQEFKDTPEEDRKVHDSLERASLDADHIESAYPEPDDFLLDIAGTTPATREEAEKIVNVFHQEWPFDYFDVAYRSDPDDDKQVLLYAGDMTYGDEPEGDGYHLVKKMLLWGIAGVWGIR